MNIRKSMDYSTLFSELDELIVAQLPQMKLYCEIGRLVSDRAEKVRLLQPLNTCKRPILRPRAFHPAICAGCGRFTQPTRNRLKSCGRR